MAAGADQPVDLRRNLLEIDLAVFRNGVVIGGITPVGRIFMASPSLLSWRRIIVPLFPAR
jgi:hypothetical protein